SLYGYFRKLSFLLLVSFFFVTFHCFLYLFFILSIQFQRKDFPGALQHTERQKKNSTEIATGNAQINMSSQRSKKLYQAMSTQKFKRLNENCRKDN
uniref:Uncharacterized protein n=1 Tax=Glossina palpalis gambiensis TaxID=67801 RepID=A0A1B0B064_9MUSC